METNTYGKYDAKIVDAKKELYIQLLNLSTLHLGRHMSHSEKNLRDILAQEDEVMKMIVGYMK